MNSEQKKKLKKYWNDVAAGHIKKLVPKEKKRVGTKLKSQKKRNVKRGGQNGKI